MTTVLSALSKILIMKKVLFVFILVLVVMNAHAMPIASTPESFLHGLSKWWHSIFG